MCSNIRKTILLGLSLLCLVSCGEYNKLLKSNDYELRYEKAKEYSDNGQYTKAVSLLKELLPVYRGSSKADEVHYYLAKSSLGQLNYVFAGEVFRSIVSEFPRSKYTEESQYMIGFCYFKQSQQMAKPRLDQQSTLLAIDALDLFMEIYPTSKRVDKSNKMILTLKEKLLVKSYLSSKLYYDMSDYKASVISLGNALKDYPETDYREELMYMHFKSKYYLGVNSVPAKKRERLNNALDEYYRFIDEWEDSVYRKECDELFEDLKKSLGIKEEDLKVNF